MSTLFGPTTPEPEPEKATILCDSLYYEGQADSADAVPVAEDS